MSKGQDVYAEPITLDIPGAIVRVYHPVLDEEERARRMKRIHDSAAELLKDVYELKKMREDEVRKKVESS